MTYRYQLSANITFAKLQNSYINWKMIISKIILYATYKSFLKIIGFRPLAVNLILILFLKCILVQVRLSTGYQSSTRIVPGRDRDLHGLEKSFQWHKIEERTCFMENTTRSFYSLCISVGFKLSSLFLNSITILHVIYRFLNIS